MTHKNICPKPAGTLKVWYLFLALCTGLILYKFSEWVYLWSQAGIANRISALKGNSRYTLTLPVKIAKLSFLLEKKKISRICFSVFAVAAKYVRMLIGFCSAYPGQHERIGNWHKKTCEMQIKSCKTYNGNTYFCFYDLIADETSRRKIQCIRMERDRIKRSRRNDRQHFFQSGPLAFMFHLISANTLAKSYTMTDQLCKLTSKS